MQNIYYFNPQNDLALATGGINYVAPPFAVQMAHDLAVIPAFIAPPGSLLITDRDIDSEWLEYLNSTFSLDVHAIKRAELRHLTDYRIMPWGWCLDLHRRLIKWGASSSCLPSKDAIYHLRGLSHRRVSIIMHLRLQELLEETLCPIPIELATTDDAMAFAGQHRNCFIKTPWSSSGRGIFHATNGPSRELAQWVNGAMKRQGSVMCEVALDKAMDFAVEFRCHDGKTSPQGFSIFNTDSHSQYSYGTVAQTRILKEKITNLYPEIDKVVDAVTQALDELVAPHYNGWLGVDMILFKVSSQSPSRPQKMGINPCIELNLRPTMGAITSVIGEKLLFPGKTATFRIEQRSGAEPWQQKKKPVIKDHRLMSGTMCLTTPSDTALYRATLSVDE